MEHIPPHLYHETLMIIILQPRQQLGTHCLYLTILINFILLHYNFLRVYKLLTYIYITITTLLRKFKR